VGWGAWLLHFASLAVRKRLRWDSLAHLGKAAVSGVEGTQIHWVRSGGCRVQVIKKNGGGEELWGESWLAKLAPGQAAPYSWVSLGLMSALASCWSLSLSSFFPPPPPLLFLTPVFSQFHGEGDERCRSKLCGWRMKIFVKSWGMLKVSVTRMGNTCTYLCEVSSVVRNPYCRKADTKLT